MRADLMTAAEEDVGLSGEMRGFRLPELLQVWAQGKKTGVLTL